MATLLLANPRRNQVVSAMAILNSLKSVYDKINKLNNRHFITATERSMTYFNQQKQIITFYTALVLGDAETAFTFDGEGDCRNSVKVDVYKRAIAFIREKLQQAIDRGVLEIKDHRNFLDELVKAFRNVNNRKLDKLQVLHLLTERAGISVDLIRPTLTFECHSQQHQYAAQVCIGKMITFTGTSPISSACLRIATNKAWYYLNDLAKVKESAEKNWKHSESGKYSKKLVWTMRKCKLCNLVIFNENFFLEHQVGHLKMEEIY